MALKQLVAAVAISCLSIGSASGLNPNDLRPKPYESRQPMAAADRLSLLGILDKHSAEYQSALDATSWQDFKDIEAPPEHIASLMSELESTRTMMREFRKQLPRLKANPNDDEAWLLLLRSYYLAAPYIDDLDERGIVKSDSHLGLRLLLPPVIDGILLPKYGG